MFCLFFSYLDICGNGLLSVLTVFQQCLALYSIYTANLIYTKELPTATIENLFWRQRVCLSETVCTNSWHIKEGRRFLMYKWVFVSPHGNQFDTF